MERLEQGLLATERERFDLALVTAGCVEGYRSAFYGREFELSLPEVRRRRLPLTVIYRTDHPPGPAGRWLIRRLVEQAEREAAARAA